MKPRIRAYSNEYWINLYRMQPSALASFPPDAIGLVIEFIHGKMELEKYIKKPEKIFFFEEERMMLNERLDNY